MKEINNQKRAQNRIQIKREDLRILKCSNSACDSTIFTQVFELGILSALINPTGQEQIIQLPKMVCIKCGSIPGLNEQNNKKEGKPKENNINKSNQLH